MAIKTVLPVKSCWIVTEGLIGLRNQAIGLAQALGVGYVIKEFKRPHGLGRFFFPPAHGLKGPWPDLLITCGRQSVPVSIAIRRASENKTFTVHIQDPLTNAKHFDVVIVPAHDKLRGENVLVTQGAIHQVTIDKLTDAAAHFRPLLGFLPRPMISILVGGKNKHQGFSAVLAHDFAQKLMMAASHSRGSLAVSFSRRTGAANEAIIRQELSSIPSYIWDGQGENPYLGLLALADAVIVTSDSISMISEASSTGKPVYIYELPNAGRRHQQLSESLIQAGIARLFSGAVETWKYTPLDETRRAAEFVYERYRTNMTSSLMGETK